MKKTVFVPLLALVAAACILLGLSLGLQGVAEDNRRADHVALLQTLLPGSTEFTLQTGEMTDPIVSVHKGQTGYVVETATQGYADQVRVLVGVSTEGKVMGLTVLDMHETWGLGGKILTDHGFLSQYLLEFEEVDAITGATVTSKAVTRCVEAAVAYATGADIESGATSWGG